MQQTALLWPEYEFVFEVNIYRFAASSWALRNINRRIDAIRPTLQGGRNVDAVDELEQYEYYRIMAEIAQRDALDTLQVWLLTARALRNIVRVHGRWVGLVDNAGVRLQNMIRAMRIQAGDNTRAVAIFNFLPRHLFE